jgi:hypothetical protein
LDIGNRDYEARLAMRKIFITAAGCLTAFANPAIAQLYGKGTPAEPESTPFASVSQDTCALIFSRENYAREVAWIGGYLSAVSIMDPNSFSTEGGMNNIFHSVEKECARLPRDTVLIDVMRRLVPITPAERVHE